jgi:hypothetical protein
MALAIDKDGNIFDKKLTMCESDIKKAISNISQSTKNKQKKVLQKALKIKINREII